MKLLTKAILGKLPPVGSQSESADPMFWVKFFTPDAGWTWFAAECEREESGDFLFWGYVIGVESEWGSFRLSELQSVRGHLGLPVERDLHFTPKPFSQAVREGK
jgi:Protein of unknown function (DUF2958)